jgi:RNA polymerase sigma-70 factor (ECF subfamily)
MNIPTKNTLEPKEFNGVTPEALREAMDQAARGCHRAFNVIFNAFHEPMVWYFIGVKKVDEQTACDLTNEVLTKVWEKASHYESERGHVTTWVYSIAEFHFIDYLRRQQSKKQYFSVYELLITEYQLDPSEIKISELSENPEQIMIKSETEDCISELFTERVIGKSLFKLMELRYVEELSLKQIADKLKMKDSTVRVNLKRGREKIQNFVRSHHALATQLSLCDF